MDLATKRRFEASNAKAGEDRFLGLPDGRRLGYTEFGDPLGIPLCAFHGTPGSRFMFRLVHETARRLGLRIIAPDRPGFGLSDYQENRTLADWADDVRALADKLGLARFGVAGISGGGPYVAACAALLPGWVWQLMKPGETSLPRASTVRSAWPSKRWPTWTMRSSS